MAEVTLEQVNGIVKTVYDESGIKDLRPDCAIMTKRVGFENGSKEIGESYKVSVALRLPNGFTYAGAQTSATTSTTLKAARPMLIKQASVTPMELDLREQVLWVALSRAAGKGKGAFAQLYGEMLKSMKLSAGIRIEDCVLNGQRSRGEVESVADAGSSRLTITFKAASWRPGYWNHVGEGATFDSFTSTTKNNGSGPLILYSIDGANRKVTFTHSGTFSDQVAADDVLYPEGAYDGTTWYEPAGLMAQAGVTSGDSLGLSTTTYNNWKGNLKTVDGEMSFDILEEACGELRDRGMTGKISGYFPNKTISKLAAELAARRIIDSSYSSSKGKVGHKNIAFETPDIGEVELNIHPFLAWGEGLLNNDEDCARVGSSDATFEVPGLPKGQIFRHLTDANAAEFVLFSDQAPINKKPCKALRFTGITHSAT